MSKKWKAFNERLRKRVNWRNVAEEILGIELIGDAGSGWVKCRSPYDEDNNPSCSFNVDSGYFKDFRTDEKAISPYDMMVRLGKGPKNFGEARAAIAGKFGIKLPEAERDDPEFGVNWKPWDPLAAERYCAAKPPIKPIALERAGARLCVRHNISCFALPVSDYNGDIVGWQFIRVNGQPFDIGKDTKPKAITKVFTKENGAFVCDPGVMPELLDAMKHNMTETVYWCEGAPDMLAGLSMFDKVPFISNCHGSGENIQWEGPANVVLIADCDFPGISGAWRRAGKGNKVFSPPGEVAKKHGRDYRDHLAELGGRGPSNPLFGLVERTDEGEQATEKDKERVKDESEEKERRHIDSAKRLLESVGCHIISVDPGKSVTLYSEKTHHVKEITHGVSRVMHEDYIQLLGWPYSSKILASQKEVDAMANNGDTGFHSYSKFKQAVALASTDSSYNQMDEVGMGIWAVKDQDRERTGDIMIVKHGATYIYRNSSLQRTKKPIVGRMIANMSTKLDWFDEGLLGEYIHRAKNVQWRNDSYNELYKIIKQWNWRHPDMPQLCVGLIMSTWIQSALSWRPIVAITGESNSGKSVLMDTLDKLFLGLAQSSAQSTAAGVLQNMGNNSRPMLLDEFDSGTEQTKLFKHFRVSSRGQEMLKGTSGQEGRVYRVRHIPWIAGIHASSKHQADLNRMINLSIKTATGNAYTLDLPENAFMRDLGHRILAGVIVTAEAALNLAQQLIKTSGDGIQSRYRESYATPYSSLGAFLGLDVDSINGIMSDYLRYEVAREVVLDDAVSDQESLLLDILQSEVRLPKDCPEDIASVAEVLFDPELSAFRNAARTKGVGYIVPRSSGGQRKVAFAGRRMTSKNGILRGTEWEQVAGVLQILDRLPARLKPVKEKQSIAGTTSTCVSVDYKELKRWLDDNSERHQNSKKEGAKDD